MISLFIGKEDVGIFCFVLTGAVAGFLMFNAYPARVFMGDTGSLALGAVLAAVAILTRREITLFVIGFVFCFETFSVMLQVFWYKLKGKRIFLMTPIHHHFEKSGYEEPDIVKGLWLVGIIFAVLGIFFAVWGILNRIRKRKTENGSIEMAYHERKGRHDLSSYGKINKSIAVKSRTESEIFGTPF